MQKENDEIKTTEIQTIESEIPVYQQQQRAQIDSQIATAKAYPRNLRRCMENAVITVTMNNEIARSCGYELRRGKGENATVIKGPSVHLASVIAQSYGNLRAEARVSEVSDKYVSAESVAFDLETNFAVKLEVRRKILDRYGNRYSEDMIHTTGLAAAAVAYRNAVLRVIPKAITDHVYNAAQNKIVGDLSDEQKLLKARTDWLKHFRNNYECTDDEILELCGIKTIEGIKKDQIATLMGVNQAIKDGETTVNEVFNRNSGENKNGETVQKKGKEFYDEKDDKKPPQKPENKENSGKLPL